MAMRLGTPRKSRPRHGFTHSPRSQCPRRPRSGVVAWPEAGRDSMNRTATGVASVTEPAHDRAAVRLTEIRKTFGNVVAAAGVDLRIEEGEFFTMLGPSGSGKTTLLRIIAGFERPDSGTVELGGADVTRRPPYLRDVNTVFQDYALFPHMTVAENVEYGLRVR